MNLRQEAIQATETGLLCREPYLTSEAEAAVDAVLGWLDTNADRIAAAHWDGDANLTYGIRCLGQLFYAGSTVAATKECPGGAVVDYEAAALQYLTKPSDYRDRPEETMRELRIVTDPIVDAALRKGHVSDS